MIPVPEAITIENPEPSTIPIGIITQTISPIASESTDRIFIQRLEPLHIVDGYRIPTNFDKTHWHNQLYVQFLIGVNLLTDVCYKYYFKHYYLFIFINLYGQYSVIKGKRTQLYSYALINAFTVGSKVMIYLNSKPCEGIALLTTTSVSVNYITEVLLALRLKDAFLSRQVLTHILRV